MPDSRVSDFLSDGRQTAELDFQIDFTRTGSLAESARAQRSKPLG